MRLLAMKKYKSLASLAQLAGFTDPFSAEISRNVTRIKPVGPGVIRLALSACANFFGRTTVILWEPVRSLRSRLYAPADILHGTKHN